MFPPDFVDRYVLAYTEPNDIVFDPFSGRGTAVFQSLLLGRLAYGIDINPVAACVSWAKADPPTARSCNQTPREASAEIQFLQERRAT